MVHSLLLALGFIFSLVKSASGKTLSDNSKSMEALFLQDVNYEPGEEEGFWGRELGKSNDSRRILGEENVNTQLNEGVEDDISAVLVKEEVNFWGRELGGSNDRKLLRKRNPSRKMDMVDNNKAGSTMNMESAHFWGRELGGSNERRLEDMKDASFWGRELGNSNNRRNLSEEETGNFWGRELGNSNNRRNLSEEETGNFWGRELGNSNDRRNLSEEETGNFWGRELGKSNDSRRMLRKNVKTSVELEDMITVEKDIESENFWGRELGQSGRDLRGGNAPLQDTEDFKDLHHNEMNGQDFWEQTLEQ